jgi:hypothetical protein
VTLPLSYSRLRARYLRSLALRPGKLRLPSCSLRARCQLLSTLYNPPSPGLPSRSSRSERRLVARGGFEPPKPLGRQIYSLLRLTAPQPRRFPSSSLVVQPASGGSFATSPGGRVSCKLLELRCLSTLSLADLASGDGGAGGGIRTPDRLITNQLLYRTELRQPDKDTSLARPVPR